MKQSPPAYTDKYGLKAMKPGDQITVEYSYTVYHRIHAMVSRMKERHTEKGYWIERNKGEGTIQYGRKNN